MNFFILLFYYFLISISVIGFGRFYCNFFFKNHNINIGFQGLCGIFILIIYSYTSHLFFPHSIEHNSLFLLIGLFFFVFFNQKKIDKVLIIIFSLNFFILFIALLIFKTHDDFPYYHFAYSYYLTQEPLLVGVGQFNHGFRTPSSLFYLNSLYYLPFIKYYSFYIPSLLFYSFSNLIIILKVYEYLKKKSYDYLFFLNILIFIFINIFFYRLQEHGTDRSAQILIAILFLQIFQIIKFDKDFKKEISLMLIPFGLIISLKAFYILYLVLFLPLIYICYVDKKFNLIKFLFKDNCFYLFLYLLSLIFLIYLLNTGCLLYPLAITCFDNFQWSIGIDETVKMNQHYQLWSKAGKTPNYSVLDPEIYLSNLNWISNWINLYFFNKVSDFFLGLLVMATIVLLFFYKKGNLARSNKKYKNIIILYSLILFLLVEWFFNHPALRYGGYIIFTLLILIPTSLFLERNHVNAKVIVPRLYVLLVITIIIFLARNILRVNNEIIKYDYKPLSYAFYYIDQNHFRVQVFIKKLIENYKNCGDNSKICDSNLKNKVREFYPERYLFVND